jgi:hypothetical protein
MSSSVSSSQRQRIEAAALRAPSQDNCQPWSFVWRDAQLLVFHDAMRAASPTNAGDHFSCLSLGCLLESVRLAAGAAGLEVGWRLALDERAVDSQSAWATLSFAPRVDSADDGLAAGLAERCTDRRLYRGGDLAHPVFAQLGQGSPDDAVCKLYLRDNSDPDLLSYLEQVEGYVWSHATTQQAFMRWIRFDAAARDGIPWQCLGGSFLESRVLLLSRSYTIHRLIQRGFISAAQRLLRHQIASSAGLGCITVRAPHAEALVGVGRLALRTWVRLNASGFAVQPLAVAVIGVYNAHVAALPSDTLPRFRELFLSGEATLRAAFGFGETETPAWLFRTGLAAAEPLAATARTPRLDGARVFRSQPSADGGASA